MITVNHKKARTGKDTGSAISYFHIFQYATCTETAATCLGVLLSFLSGGGITVCMTVLGEMATAFVERTHPPLERPSAHLPIISTFGGGRRLYFNATHEENMAALLEDAVANAKCVAVVVAACLLLITVGTALINWSALKQITTIQMLLLQAILRQDMSWFDTDNEVNLASMMSQNIISLREGMGEKLASMSNLLGTAILSICIAFPMGWELSLACTTVIPFSLAATVIVSNYQTKSTIREMEAYSQAGKHAEEILKSVKTVVAFGGEPIEISRYGSLLQPAEQYGRRRGVFHGLGTGATWVLLYCQAAIAISYGTRLILRDEHKPADEPKYVYGSLYSILINLFTAAQVLSMCIPYSEAFGAARGAAASIFQLINRTPAVDSSSKEGLAPQRVLGEITLQNVHFSYPSRPKIKILNNFSIHIKPGECVAFVGSSGCGKTTLLQLLQRLYEPSAGSVKLDGQDLSNLNLHWLRTSYGVVGQEPVLFRGTVFENIAIGCQHATLEEVQRVAAMANAHDFIKNLPMGYDTVISERGASLSGGQKQRVANARALLRDPAVLVLDEPTSALDPHAELQVQAALDRARAGRTTLLVSHRLSTIVNADRIVCMDKGAIVEQGTHDELVAKKGYYHRLLTTVDRDKEKMKAPQEISIPLEETQEQRNDTECKDGHTSLASHSSGTPVTSAGAGPRKQYDDQDSGEVSNWQILRLNAPEWAHIAVGSVAAFTQGSCVALLGVIFGFISAIFVLEDHAQILYLADLYAGLFLVIAALAGACMWLQSFTFTMAGLKMTSRLRIQYFTALLRQEMGFYDKEGNTVGALCSRLSGDAADVQLATGRKVGILLQGVSSVFVGVCISLYYDWRLALVATAFVPLLVGSTWLENRMSQKSQIQERNALEAATGVATEAILGVRTVQSLSIETIFVNKFHELLNEACAAVGVTLCWRGLAMGIALYMSISSCCCTFIYGTTMIASGTLEYKVIILVTESIIFSAYILGQSLVYSSSSNKVNRSTARILSLIKRTPSAKAHTDVQDDEHWPATGNFNLDDVKFTYPTRGNQVLAGVDLTVAAGQTVALVGPSGCGKSTILQLMQRFYDPDSGTIRLDGRDAVRALSAARLRGALGVVQQEPALFDRSLADNVAYGDNGRRVPLSEVVAACQTANIHAFISSLPDGYATRLGAGGAQLSGGQKQRVCIARALVRAPRLLLLDEATSALDAASERVVSEALDRAAEGRTCVTIAHRLSTIERADVIFVLREGRVVERGSHADLLKMRGLYYRMHKEQHFE